MDNSHVLFTCGSGILEILESPGILLWHFPGLESPGKLMQVLESPGNLYTLVMKFPLKTIFCSIIFGFLFYFNYCAFGSPGKIYLCPEKVLGKSWKIVSEKGHEPLKLQLDVAK